jgi:trigger factor
MKYTVEKKEGKLFINFTVKNEEWETFVQKAYEQTKGKYNVPGFRKGHVPRRVLENTYGKGIFFEDALYASATEYYGQYLDKNKSVVPVARPVLDESSVKVDEKGVKYSVVVVVKPDVVLGEYKGLTIAKTKVPAIKAAEVDAEIKRV